MAGTDGAGVGNWWIAGVAAPAILLVVSTMAAWTEWVGPVRPWLAVPAVVVMVGLAAWAVLRRPRIPRWYPWVSLGTMLLGAYGLQATELLAPLTFAAAAGLLWFARQVPQIEVPDRTRRWSTGAEPARPAPLTRPEPSPLTRTPSPARRIRLATRGHVVLFAAVGAPVLALGAWTLWATVATSPGLQTAARVMGAVFGGLLTVFGLAFVVIAAQLVRGPAIELVVDHEGIRRLGHGTWDVAWTQVRAVGVTLDERLVHTTSPVPSAVRRRRDLRVVLEMAAPAPGPGQSWPTASAPPPFTHADRLPDATWSSRSRVADELDAALRAHVPDLYAGTGRR